MLSWIVIFFRGGLPAGDWLACDSECTPCDSECTPCDRMGPNVLGQGIVLADTKTARPSLRVFVPSSAVVPALNAFGLFARVKHPFLLDNTIAVLVFVRRGI